MPLTLEQAQRLAKQQAHKDMGIEFDPRVPMPPGEDAILQAILKREAEFRRDDRTPARIQGIAQHLDAIDRQIDALVYKAEITPEIIYELGLLTLLWHYHLERIELGDQNLLARQLLTVYRKLM
jgi:hypothetical protein